MRPDGRVQLHIHGSMETPDGARIALSATGTTEPKKTTGLLELRQNVELHTASPAFAWVNTISVWGRGTIDVATGELIIKAYAA